MLVITYPLNHLTSSLISLTYSHKADVEVTKKVNDEIKNASKFDTYRITNNASYMKQQQADQTTHDNHYEMKGVSPLHSI